MTKFSFEDPAQRRQLDTLEDRIMQLEARLETTISPDGAFILPPSTITGEGVVPTGGMMAWSTTTAPEGWLLCDGSAVSREDHFDLFEVIGTTFGNGNGSTTFNVPDLRGRFPLGLAAAGTGSTLGGTGGSLDHTHGDGSLSVASHNHGAGSLSADGHTHGGGSYVVDNHQHGASGTLAVAGGAGSHVHSIGETKVMVDNNADGVQVSVTQDVDANTGAEDVGGADITGVTSQQTASTGLSGNSGSSGAGVSGNTGAAAPDVTGSTGSANPAFLATEFIIKT